MDIVATAKTPMDATEKVRPALINISVGKQASQSSYSQWSHPGEAANAIATGFRGEYAFHTEKEANPWWQLDLELSCPIELIVVSNRIGGFEERARTLKVEISEDSKAWKTIHSGFAKFGSYATGNAISFEIGSELQGRYIRLSLAENEYLHLSRVEVLAKPEIVALAKFSERFGLPRYHMNQNPTPSRYKAELAGYAPAADIVGIKIDYSGRFGNLLHQYVNVIQLALRTGLGVIQLGRHELFDVKAPFSVGEITFIPHGASLPLAGAYICGEFFNSDDFIPVLPPFLQFQPEEEVEFTGIVQKYILPHMLTGIPLANEAHPADELTIHIRAGDIFSSDHPVTYGYRQPPLSFYQLVIGRMRSSGRINKVRLVFEDRGNPCIDALELWLEQEDIPYRESCGSLHEDMSALIDAPHLVFGHGTFGYAACRLSKRIETVHYFEPELGGSYAALPTIGEVYSISDNSGTYIKAFQYGQPFGSDDGWRNTPEMRQRMLEFSMTHLVIDQVQERGLVRRRVTSG